MLRIAYLESGYKSNVADRRRLHPLIRQAPDFGVEMVPYARGVSSDIILIRGRTHPTDFYRNLRKNAIGKIVFDEPNDLSTVLEVGYGKRIARGIRYWIKGQGHPADALAAFVRDCDLVVQGSSAQNECIATEVRNTAAIVDALPALEFDGEQKRHKPKSCPVVIWDGTGASFPQLLSIEPALAEAARHTNFKLLVFTDRWQRSPRRSGIDIEKQVSRFRCQTEFREWSLELLKPTLHEADVALAVVDMSTRFNRVKPANKMISYWAYGLPVVATRSAAYSEIAENGIDALLTDNNVGWSSSIRQLVDSVELRAHMGNRGFRKAWNGYSEVSFAGKYFSLFKKIL